MWKWLTGILAGVLIMCLAQFVRDDLKYFRNGATRDEVAAIATKTDQIDKTVAALNAEVLSTLRAVQNSLSRVEGDIKEIRGERSRP